MSYNVSVHYKKHDDVLVDDFKLDFLPRVGDEIEIEGLSNLRIVKRVIHRLKFNVVTIYTS